MNSAYRASIGLVVVGLAACLDDWAIDEQTFPCRVPADCVSGFACHPERFVCVPADDVETGENTADETSMDAGFSDAS